MSDQHARSYAETTPKLAELGRDVLFGDVWERPGLSKRDRSLVTVAALVTGNYPKQMPFHIQRALENGVTEEELKEVVTHLAFYAGWLSLRPRPTYSVKSSMPALTGAVTRREIGRLADRPHQYPRAGCWRTPARASGSSPLVCAHGSPTKSAHGRQEYGVSENAAGLRKMRRT